MDSVRRISKYIKIKRPFLTQFTLKGCVKMVFTFWRGQHTSSVELTVKFGIWGKRHLRHLEKHHPISFILFSLKNDQNT